MLAKIRRIAQVTLLTATLVFGTMLMIGNFDTSGWASSHHTTEAYWGIGNLHITYEEYKN